MEITRQKVYPSILIAFLNLCMFVSWPAMLFAQNDRAYEILNRANKFLRDGEFKKCNDVLLPSFEKIAKDQYFEAYRLLAISSIYLQDEKQASLYVKKLLIAKPDYFNYPYTDPIELNRLLKTYCVFPGLEIGGLASVGITTVRPIRNYSVTGTAATFLPTASYQCGIGAEYHISKRYSLNAAFLVEGSGYERQSDLGGNLMQNFNERMVYLGIPISARWYWTPPAGKSMIGIELGLQLNYLLRTESNIVLANHVYNESLQHTLDQYDQRKAFTGYIFPGIVWKYPAGGGYITAGVLFYYGLHNIINSIKRYSDADFIMTNQYVDSDIALTSYLFRFGYQMPLNTMYRVKKLRAAK